MWIWLICLGCIVALGVTGYFKGAIRSAISLVGLVLACWLAVPLAPKFYPLVHKLGFTHPFSAPVIAPFVVYFLITVLFIGAAFLVDWQIRVRYRFAMDDYTRLRWNRLNCRLGASIGLVAGLIYGVVLCLIIYILGYPFVYFATDSAPGWQRFLRQARLQLHHTGMDRCVASLDPMPVKFYKVVDLLALIYYNPSVYPRLAVYPDFLECAEISEFRDIANDPQILGTFQTQGDLVSLLNHPKILAILNNPQHMSRFAQVDLDDLYQFLLTGKSQKYSDQPILGRWKIDLPATYVAIRRKQPDMNLRQMSMVKLVLTMFLPKLQFVAMPTGSVLFKVQLTEQAEALRKKLEEAIVAREKAIQQAINPYGPYDPSVAQRYGFGGDTEERKATRTRIPLVPPVPGMPQFDFSGTGTWQSRGGGQYSIRVKDELGNQLVGSAQVSADGTLRIEFGNWVLIFYPALYWL